MAAGDTISGTVVVEPMGSNDQEKTVNGAELRGYVISLSQSKPTGTGSDFTVNVPLVTPGTFTLKIPTSGSTNSNGLGIRLTNADGSHVLSGSQTIPLNAAPQSVGTAQSGFQLPKLGQTGRPIEILGQFDGNAANTSLNIGGQNVNALTESPRGLIFLSPTNITGPTELSVKDGNNQSKGEYRNVDVKLSAPTTTLTKGESTTLTIEVLGLKGIQENVPLELSKTGVVTMEGGDFQTRIILPTEVADKEPFTFTRSLTGQQAGAFGVTATVVISQPMAIPANQPSPTPQPSPTIQPNPTPQPQSTPTSQPAPSPQPQSTPSTQPTPPINPPTGGETTVALRPCDLQGEIVHVESTPNGNENAWIIEIKLPNGKKIKIRMKGKKPALKFCNWIKIKTCHTENGEIYIDDWEKTVPPKPPPPKEPEKPTEPVGPPSGPPTGPEPVKPPEPPPAPEGGGEKPKPAPEPPCKEGAKKTERRITSCELSESVTTPLGQTPTSVDVMDVITKILELLGAESGVEIGTKLSEAFSTNKAHHIWVKFNVKYVDDTYECKNGKWVLVGSVPGVYTTAWKKLFDSQGGGGFNWLPGSTAGDLQTAIDSAKPEGCP
jgi:hypothetical protein